MIQTVRKAWAIPELKKKIVFTLLILLIFRIGNAITVPYIDVAQLESQLQGMGATILGLYNVMSGRAWKTWRRTAARRAGRRSNPSPATPPWPLPFSRPWATTS